MTKENIIELKRRGWVVKEVKVGGVDVDNVLMRAGLGINLQVSPISGRGITGNSSTSFRLSSPGKSSLPW